MVGGLLLQLGLAHREAGAGDQADDQAGDQAGDRTGDQAGHQAGDRAGDQAGELLKEAGDVYKIVPGVKHPFYKDDFLSLL